MRTSKGPFQGVNDKVTVVPYVGYPVSSGCGTILGPQAWSNNLLCVGLWLWSERTQGQCNVTPRHNFRVGVISGGVINTSHTAAQDTGIFFKTITKNCSGEKYLTVEDTIDAQYHHMLF